MRPRLQPLRRRPFNTAAYSQPAAFIERKEQLHVEPSFGSDRRSRFWLGDRRRNAASPARSGRLLRSLRRLPRYRDDGARHGGWDRGLGRGWSCRPMPRTGAPPKPGNGDRIPAKDVCSFACPAPD
jgi:hypothetical protein